MYVTVNNFKIQPGREDESKAFVSDLLEDIKGLKGFVSAVIYQDKETNEWGRTLVWETKEDWDAYAGSEMSSKYRERGRELVDGSGEMKRYEVVGYVTAD